MLGGESVKPNITSDDKHNIESLVSNIPLFGYLNVTLSDYAIK